MGGLVRRSDAARRLGVTDRQVGYLVAGGELSQPVRGWLDATSVERYAVIPRTGTRAWAEPTAWAAVALLSDVTPHWMGQSQLSRLRNRLTGLSAEQVVERTRRRAVVTRWIAHPSGLPRLAASVVEPDTAGLGLAPSAGTSVDGYVAVGAVDSLVVAHGLVRDDDGALTLRATTLNLEVVRELAGHSTLAALDLAGSLDPRERALGLSELENRLYSSTRG